MVTTMARRVRWAVICLLATFPVTCAAAFTVDDLLALRRLGHSVLSPDSKLIVFELAVADVAAGRMVQHLYIVPTAGGAIRQLTNGSGSEAQPCWTADAQRVVFMSPQEGVGQLWEVSVSGGDPRQITSIATGARQPRPSPDGKWIAFLSDVDPGSRPEVEPKDVGPASNDRARLLDHFPYRRDGAWLDRRCTHIMMIPASGGDARDLTPGNADSPASADEAMGFVFSPDSSEVCFSRSQGIGAPPPANPDLFIVEIASGGMTRLTDNPGDDADPAYSADGRYIAYRSRVGPSAGFGRWQLMLYDRLKKTTRPLTQSLDRWVNDFAFSEDGKTIYFSADDSGSTPLYAVNLSGEVKKLPLAVTASAPIATRSEIIFRCESFREPADIYAVSPGKKNPRRITSLNADLLAPFALSPGESIHYPGAGGVPVQAWVVKPASFDPQKRYPLLLLIHDGPQAAAMDRFDFQWNAQVFANAGFVVLLPNPRGSTGFGQSYVDAIHGDWGGRAYIDLMAGVEFMCKQPYVDGSRLGAAGGSFGGYMVNWIAGRTDRFKALVSHAGHYNFLSAYGTTDEPWSLEGEFGGTPWDHPDAYQTWSPHGYAGQIRTPMLITHGELDSHVPISESQQLFAALQRRKIPSRFLWFPDEGREIARPGNSRLWYAAVLSWLRTYLLES